MLFEKKSFYKCQIHDIMSKNESRVCTRADMLDIN